MRVLLCGASGFVGSHVARALRQRGVEVLEQTRGAASTSSGVSCDLAELARGSAALDGLRFDAVVNAAAHGADGVGESADLFRVNVQGALALWHAAARAGAVRFVQIGSALELGGSPHALDDDAELAPRTPYASSKAAASLLLLQLGQGGSLPVTVMRLFNLFGPGDRERRLIPSLLRAGRAGRAIELHSPAERRDFAFVDDAAWAIARLVTLPEGLYPHGTALNFARGESHTVAEFAALVADAAGAPVPVSNQPTEAAPPLLHLYAHPRRWLSLVGASGDVQPVTPLARAIRATCEAYS